MENGILAAATDRAPGSDYEWGIEVNLGKPAGAWILSYRTRAAGDPISATQRLRLGSDDLIREIVLSGGPPCSSTRWDA
ncbi:hypothetical protein MXD62_14055 [Frankia sp. Mgl5]|nr:hypothetical protein [Frankia sp. Mgl5]